jgi:N-acyl homoserine lactone hydrolase
MSLYSIWVLEYAFVQNYNVSGVLYGAHNQGYLKLPYAYVVIKGEGHVIMVDVGYNQRDYGKTLADRFGVEAWHSPKDVLAQIGLSPEDVDSIFITHAHFDHMGNLDDFPNAHVYVQEREIARAIWALSQPPRLSFVSIATDPADVLKCAALAQTVRTCSLASTSGRRRIPTPTAPNMWSCAMMAHGIRPTPGFSQAI